MNAVHPMNVYRVMLALSDVSTLEAWIRLAGALAIEPFELYLSGLIVMPQGVSLSEGTFQARAMRDTLDAVARSDSQVGDETRVYVDYRPFTHVLDAIQRNPCDLLLVQWAGPETLTGGVPTEELLQAAPCDVVLLSRSTWETPGPVLLALRGGPNLSLGARVAQALAGTELITLFNAAEDVAGSPMLSVALLPGKQRRRTVSMVGNPLELILSEAAHHQAVIMGAGAPQLGRPGDSVSPILRQIFARTDRSVAMVRSAQPEEVGFHPPRPLRRPEPLSVRVDRWFAENTFDSHEFTDLRALLAMKEKQGTTIGLALPALNEEATVGKVIRTLQQALMRDVPLLDELVLIDSNSEDRTVEIAGELGVPVYKHPDILPEMGSYRGKGEALWKSLGVTRSDLIAWIDTDITNIHPRFVYGLIGPLLKRPDVQYVKGFYRRPLTATSGGRVQAQGGGRVTELVARPLLNLFYPELSGIVQPLSGEYAGRRKALEAVPFFSGYGVETGLLIDLHSRFGLTAIAQSDLEERVHHSQSLINLSKMSFAILQVFIARLEGRYSVQLLENANRSMKLIIQEPDRLALEIAEIGDVERPPMKTIYSYRQAFGMV